MASPAVRGIAMTSKNQIKFNLEIQTLNLSANPFFGFWICDFFGSCFLVLVSWFLQFGVSKQNQKPMSHPSINSG